MRTDSLVYFIRHARSTYNEAEATLREKFKDLSDKEFEKTPEYLKMKFNM